MSRIIVFTLLLALITPGCSDSESFESLSKNAEEGDAIAQFRVAQMLLSGVDVEKDITKAEFWLMKAGQQGEIDAQIALASLYIDELSTNPDTNNVTENKRKVFEWIESAANRENVEAQRLFAIMHGGGIGTHQSEKKYREWTMRAAENGDADAQLNVSYFYSRDGRGYNRSLDKQIEWATKAAEQGNPHAMLRLGGLYTDTYISPEERAFTDVEKGKTWNTKAFERLKVLAEQGDVDAQYALGNIYFSKIGAGITKTEDAYDREKSFQWYLRAAEQGHPYAQYEVANAYANGGKAYAVEKDKAQAIEWYKKAANQGVSEAQNMLNGGWLSSE